MDERQEKNVSLERENCTLLVGEYEGKVNPNPQEVSNFNYASLLELKEKITKETETYIPWFKIALEKISETFLLKTILMKHVLALGYFLS